MFNLDQIKELTAKLDPANVTQRTQSGRTLDYIEGWFAISEANRIFGFDAWDRQTVTMTEVRRDQVNDKYGKPQWRVGYMAKVMIIVKGIDSMGEPCAAMREGTGFGSGAMGDLGEAIESAIKEAETDAMKRALMTFGNPFGLALYDKSRANVGVDEQAEESKPELKSKAQAPSKAAPNRAFYEVLVADLRRCDVPADCDAWWRDGECVKLRAQLPLDWLESLKDEFKAHKQSLVTKVANDQQNPFSGG